MSDDGLLDLLQGDKGGEIRKVVSPLPGQVRVSKHVLAQASTVCKLVKEIGKADFEWFSFLLAHKADKRYVASDLLLVPGAKVEIGHVAIDGELHARAARAVD